MSGGHFNYIQQNLDWEVLDELDRIIKENGKKKTQKELDEGWFDPEYYRKYPEDLYHHKYPDEVMKKFKEGREIIKKAAIYIQRIDWLLSGGDGEESFLKRIEEDLKQL